MTNTIQNLLSGVATPKDLKGYAPILKRLTLKDGRTAQDVFSALLNSKYDLGTMMSQDVEYMKEVTRDLPNNSRYESGSKYSDQSLVQYEVDLGCFYPEYYKKNTVTKRVGKDAISCVNPAGIQKELEITRYVADNPNSNHAHRFTTITAPPMKAGTYLLLTGHVSTKQILSV